MAILQDVSIFTGETASFTVTLLPPTNIDGWNLEFHAQSSVTGAALAKVIGSGITVLDQAKGVFKITFTNQDTILQSPGTWWWDVRRLDDENNQVLGSGAIYVLPGVSTATITQVSPVTTIAVHDVAAGSETALAEQTGSSAIIGGLSGDYNCPLGTLLYDCVYLSAPDSVDLACAASEVTMPAIGFVTALQTSTRCTVQFFGEVSGFIGPTPGQKYFVSTTPGQIVAVGDLGYPTNPGQVVQRVGLAKNATTFLVFVDATAVVL